MVPCLGSSTKDSKRIWKKTHSRKWKILETNLRENLLTETLFLLKKQLVQYAAVAVHSKIILHHVWDSWGPTECPCPSRRQHHHFQPLLCRCADLKWATQPFPERTWLPNHFHEQIDLRVAWSCDLQLEHRQKKHETSWNIMKPWNKCEAQTWNGETMRNESRVPDIFHCAIGRHPHRASLHQGLTALKTRRLHECIGGYSTCSTYSTYSTWINEYFEWFYSFTMFHIEFHMHFTSLHRFHSKLLLDHHRTAQGTPKEIQTLRLSWGQYS